MTIRARLLALCTIALGVALPAQAARAQDSGIEVGAAAPGAAVQTLDGKPFDLASLVGKQPLVLEFWAVWCSNCKQLEPSLRALHAKYGTRVRFAGVAVSANQSPALVQKYVAKYKVPWLQLYDARGRATGAYDVPATSYVVVIDRAGKVVYTGVGGVQPGLEAAIRGAL
ncbi:MAG: TlpA family protein disulfide reductase [Gemmatimonadaceae bacterium]